MDVVPALARVLAGSLLSSGALPERRIQVAAVSVTWTLQPAVSLGGYYIGAKVADYLIKSGNVIDSDTIAWSIIPLLRLLTHISTVIDNV